MGLVFNATTTRASHSHRNYVNSVKTKPVDNILQNKFALSHKQTTKPDMYRNTEEQHVVNNVR